MYFNEKKTELKKQMSEFDSLFSVFLDINNTQDAFDIHDNVIKAIRQYYGTFNPEHVELIQTIIEKYLGEARVEGATLTEEVEEIKKPSIETSSKFKRVKI